MLNIPPHDYDVEKSILWKLILHDEYFFDLELKDYDFYWTENKIIFQNILEIRKSWKKIDLISLKENLERNNLLEKIWWISTLLELTEYLDYSSDFFTYQEILKEKSRLRKILKLTQIIQKNIWEEKSSSDILQDFYKILPKIERDISEAQSMADVYENTFEYLEKIKNTELVWISYWKQFEFLDLLTGWIQPGNIIRIWGWSNVWKTWLLLNFLLEVVEKDWNVTFFSLENSENFTLKNIYWLKKWVNSLPEYIKKNKVDFSSEANYFFWKENFYIDTKSRTLWDIFRKTLKNKSKIIFIDYIQLVRTEWSTKNDRLTQYAFEIQEFAKKNWITVFDLSQLSNEANRWWSEWVASTEFYWASELKSSCDVWIHIFENKEKMKLKQQCIVWWDNRDYFRNFVKVKISKNRLWAWVWRVEDFIIDFSKWGKFLLEDNNF